MSDWEDAAEANNAALLLKDKVRRLETEMAQHLENLESVISDLHQSQAAVTFVEERVLHEVSEWMDSIGQHLLARRLDPRRTDDFRKNGAHRRIIESTH